MALTRFLDLLVALTVRGASTPTSGAPPPVFPVGLAATNLTLLPLLVSLAPKESSRRLLAFSSVLTALLANTPARLSHKVVLLAQLV